MYNDSRSKERSIRTIQEVMSEALERNTGTKTLLYIGCYALLLDRATLTLRLPVPRVGLAPDYFGLLAIVELR